jgi:hypothetical protein
MKKCLLLLTTILVWSSTIFGQSIMFDPLDEVVDSTRYNLQILSVDGSDTSQVILEKETSIVAEGTAAMRATWITQRAQSWGGFTKFQIFHPDSNSVWDFSPFENLVLKYYNDVPSSDPGHVHLRILFTDVSDAPIDTYDGNAAELWYSFEYILDDAPGWNEIILPLEDVGPAAFNGMNGFYRTGWAGITGNDHLDLNKIKGIHFEFSIDGPQDFSIHSGSIIFDSFRFAGARELPLVFFNGKVIPSDMQSFVFNGGMTVEENAGHIPNTNAIRWDQAPGQPWTGFGFLFEPKFLTFRWDLDSLKFWVKAPSGTGELRMVMASGDAPEQEAVYILPDPGYNGDWQFVKIALKDFTSGTAFDTSAVRKFVFMSNGNGNGHTIYVDDLWTGNPPVDVIPPDAPVPPVVVTDTYSNLITWLDVPGENGETYNIYYSENPITDVTAPGVRMVDLGQNRPENSGSWTHLLFSPLADSTTSYYYAVTAVDQAGNESAPGVTAAPVTNTAKGIATISLSAPANFTADGNLADWSGIQPFELKPSMGSHIVTNTTIDGDGDLSYKVYLAIDNDYLYFAFDATDDVVDTTSLNTWEKDSPDLFLGLYNQTKIHSNYDKGAEPDYHFRFLPNKVIIDNRSGIEIISGQSADYHWGTKFPIGYVIEGRIALDDLASATGDSRFSPRVGYRIPFDLALNDADGGGVRQGIMTWSPYNDDTSWQSTVYWLYTWLGSTWVTGIDRIDDAIPGSFELSQNYPNPFNPSTTISYRIPDNSEVTLEIFNALGQRVGVLVQQKQTAGTYNVTFDARNLASGVYFYRLQAGNNVQVRKMLLMK